MGQQTKNHHHPDRHTSPRIAERVRRPKVAAENFAQTEPVVFVVDDDGDFEIAVAAGIVAGIVFFAVVLPHIFDRPSIANGFDV